MTVPTPSTPPSSPSPPSSSGSPSYTPAAPYDYVRQIQAQQQARAASQQQYYSSASEQQNWANTWYVGSRQQQQASQRQTVEGEKLIPYHTIRQLDYVNPETGRREAKELPTPSNMMSWTETYLRGSLTPEQQKKITKPDWEKIRGYTPLPTGVTTQKELIVKAAGSDLADRVFAPPDIAKQPVQIQISDTRRAELLAQSRQQGVFGGSSIQVKTNTGELVTVQTGKYTEEIAKLYSQGKLTEGKQYELYSGTRQKGVITKSGETILASEAIHGKTEAQKYEGAYAIGEKTVTVAPYDFTKNEIVPRDTTPTLPHYGAPVPGDTYNVYVPVGGNKYLKMPASQAEQYLKVAKDFGVISADHRYTFVTGSKKPVGTFAFESTKLVPTETGEYRYVPQAGGIPVLDIDYVSSSGQDINVSAYGADPSVIAANIKPGEGSPYTKFVVKDGYYYGVKSDGSEVKMNKAEKGVLPDPFTYYTIPYGDNKTAKVRMEFLEEDIKKLVAEGTLSKDTKYDIFDVGGKDIGDITPALSATGGYPTRINIFDDILYGSAAEVPPWISNQIATAGGPSGDQWFQDLSTNTWYMYSGAGYMKFVPDPGQVGVDFNDLLGTVYVYKNIFSGGRYESELNIYKTEYGYDLPTMWKGETSLVGTVGKVDITDWLSHAQLTPTQASKPAETVREWGIQLFSPTGQSVITGAAWLSPEEIVKEIKLTDVHGYKEIKTSGGYYYGVTQEGKEERLNVAEYGVLPDISAYASSVVSGFKPPAGSPYEKYVVEGGYYYAVTPEGNKVKLNIATTGTAPNIDYTGAVIEDWSKIPEGWGGNIAGYSEYVQGMQNVTQLRYDEVRQYYNALKQYNPNEPIKAYAFDTKEFIGTIYKGELWEPGTFTSQAKADLKTGSFVQFQAGTKTLAQQGLTPETAPPGTRFYDPLDMAHPFKTVYAVKTSEGKIEKFVYEPTDLTLYTALAIGPNPFEVTTQKQYDKWVSNVQESRKISLREEQLRAGKPILVDKEISSIDAQKKQLETLSKQAKWVSYEHLGLMGETPTVPAGSKIAFMTDTGLQYMITSETMVAYSAPILGGLKPFKLEEIQQAKKISPRQMPILKIWQPRKEEIIKAAGERIKEPQFTIAPVGSSSAMVESAFGSWKTPASGTSPVKEVAAPIGKTFEDIINSFVSTAVKPVSGAGSASIASMNEVFEKSIVPAVFKVGGAYFGSPFAWTKYAYEGGRAYGYQKEKEKYQKQQIELLEKNPGVKSYLEYFSNSENIKVLEQRQSDVDKINKAYDQFSVGGFTAEEETAYNKIIVAHEEKWKDLKVPVLSEREQAILQEYENLESQRSTWESNEMNYRRSVGIPSLDMNAPYHIEQYQQSEVLGGEQLASLYKSGIIFKENVYEPFIQAYLQSKGIDIKAISEQGIIGSKFAEAIKMTYNVPIETAVGIPALLGGFSVLGTTAVDPNRSVFKEFTGSYLPYAIVTTGERAVAAPELFAYEMALNYVTLKGILKVGRGVTGFRFVTGESGTPYLRTKYGIIGEKALGTTKMVVVGGDIKKFALTWTDPITSMRIEFGKTPQWTIGSKLTEATVEGRFTGVKSTYPTKTIWQSVKQPWATMAGKTPTPDIFTKVAEGSKIFKFENMGELKPGDVIDVARFSKVMRPVTYEEAFPEYITQEEVSPKYTVSPSGDVKQSIGRSAFQLASDISSGIISTPEKIRTEIEYQLTKPKLVGYRFLETRRDLPSWLLWTQDIAHGGRKRFVVYGEEGRGTFEVPLIDKQGKPQLGTSGEPAYLMEFIETRGLTPEFGAQVKDWMDVVLKHDSKESAAVFKEIWELEKSVKDLPATKPKTTPVQDVLRTAPWITAEEAVIVTKIIRGTAAEPTIFHGGFSSKYWFARSKQIADIDLYVTQHVLEEKMMPSGYVDPIYGTFGIFGKLGIENFDWMRFKEDFGKPLEYGTSVGSYVGLEEGFAIESFHEAVMATVFRSHVPVVNPITGEISLYHKPTKGKAVVDLLARVLPEVEQRTGKKFPHIKEFAFKRILEAPSSVKSIELYPRIKDITGLSFEEFAAEQGIDLVELQKKIDTDYARTYVGDTGFTYTSVLEKSPYYRSIPSSERVIAEFGTGTPIEFLGIHLFTVPGLKQYVDVTDMFSSKTVPERAIIKGNKFIELEAFVPEFLIASPKRVHVFDIPTTYIGKTPDLERYDPFGINFAPTRAVSGYSVYETQYVKKLSGFGFKPEFYRNIILREGYIPDKFGSVEIPAMVELLKHKDIGVFPEKIMGKMKELTEFVSEPKALSIVKEAYAEGRIGRISTSEMFVRQLIAIETSIKAAPWKPRTVHSPEEVILSKPEMKEQVRTGYADYIDKISGAMLKKAENMGDTIYGTHGLEHVTKVEENLLKLREMYPETIGRYSPEVIHAVAKYHDVANLEEVPNVEGFMKWLPHERVAAEAIISGKFDVFEDISKLTPEEKGIVAETIRESHFKSTPYDLSRALQMADEMAWGTKYRFTEIKKLKEYGMEIIPAPEYFPKGKFAPVVPMKYVEPTVTTLGDVVLTTFKTDPRLQGAIIGGSFGQQIQMEFSRMWGDIDLYARDVTGAKFALYENIYIHGDIFKKYGWELKDMAKMFDIHPLEKTGSFVGRFGIKTESPVIVEGLRFMPIREQYLRKVTQIAEVRLHEGKFYTGVEPHRGKDIADYLGISTSLQHDILSGKILTATTSYRSMITGEALIDTSSVIPKVFADITSGRKIRLIEEGIRAVEPMLHPDFMPTVGKGEALRDPLDSAISRLEQFEWRYYQQKYKNIPLTKRWIRWGEPKTPDILIGKPEKLTTEPRDLFDVDKRDLQYLETLGVTRRELESDYPYFYEYYLRDFVDEYSITKEGSINRYTEEHYDVINKILRERIDYSEYPLIRRAYIKRDIAVLDKLTQSSLERSAGTTIFRGVRGQTFRDVINTQIGDIIPQDKAFKSFSKDIETAMGFSVETKYGEGVLLRHVVKPGERGFYIGGGEQEIILPRDVEFKVTNISMEGKYLVYDVDTLSKPVSSKNVIDLIKTGFGRFDAESGMLFPERGKTPEGVILKGKHSKPDIDITDMIKKYGTKPHMLKFTPLKDTPGVFVSDDFQGVALYTSSREITTKTPILEIEKRKTITYKIPSKVSFEEALGEYVDNVYVVSDINRLMREGRIDTISYDAIEHSYNKIQTQMYIDTILQNFKPSTQTIDLYRGIRNTYSTEILKMITEGKLTTGTIIEELGLQSFSENIEIAKRFATSKINFYEPNKPRIIFEYKLTIGEKHINVGKNRWDEIEHILPPGKFEVTKITIGDKTDIFDYLITLKRQDTTTALVPIEAYKLKSPQEVGLIKDAIKEYARESKPFTKIMVGGDMASMMKLREPLYVNQIIFDIDRIYSAFEPTEKPVVIYRGLGLKEAKASFEKIIAGTFKEYQRSSFLSFSKNLDIAHSFADIVRYETGKEAPIYTRIMLRTTIKPGDFAIDRNIGFHYAREREVILPPTQFKVERITPVTFEGVDEITGKHIYTMSSLSDFEMMIVDITPVKSIGKLPLNIREVTTSADVGIIRLPEFTKMYYDVSEFKYPGAKYPISRYPLAEFIGGYMFSGYASAVDTSMQRMYPSALAYPKEFYPVAEYSISKYQKPTKYTSSIYQYSDYLFGKYPSKEYPKLRVYPREKYTTGKYQSEIYPIAEYAIGEYPVGKYPVGEYTIGKYPTGNYLFGKYLPSKYKPGYPLGEYKPGYPLGEYPIGKYQPGKYLFGKYIPAKYSPGKYPGGQYGGEYSGGQYGGEYSGGQYGGEYPPGKYFPGRYVYPPPPYTPPPYIPPPPIIPWLRRKRIPEEWIWLKFKKQQFFLYSEITPTWSPKQMATLFPMRLASTRYRRAFGEPIRINRDMFDKFVGMPKGKRKRRIR